MKHLSLTIIGYAVVLLVVLPACGQPIPEKGVNHQFAGGMALEQAISDESFKQITSVLVSAGGDLVYENYWGKDGPGQLNDTRSAMKTLTALAVGAAVDDGHIPGVQAAAMSWFEAERPFRFSTELKDEITVRDLLTMSSAFDCDDNVRSSPGNEEHMHPARNWTYFVLDLPTKIKYSRDNDGYGPFVYCTANSFLLGQVVQRAVGEQVDHFIQRRILDPLGIQSILWHQSPSGEIMTGGGAEMSSMGLLKLGQLILNEGMHGDQRVISSAWIDEMTTAHRNANERQDYGYQIWREDFVCGDGTTESWYMGGNGGNKIAVFPELDAVVVITSTLYNTQGMHQQSTDILERFVLPSLEKCLTQES